MVLESTVNNGIFNSGVFREYVIEKRFWKTNEYFDEFQIAPGAKLIKGKWVPNRKVGWSDWTYLRGFNDFLAAEVAILYLNKSKRKSKLTIEYQIIKYIDINKATLDIKELCEG